MEDPNLWKKRHIISEQARTCFHSEWNKKVVRQDLETTDELYIFAPEIQEKHKEICQLLSKDTACEIKLGDIKDRDTAEKKIDKECGGDPFVICDIVRAKLIVNSPEEIKTLLEKLNPNNNKGVLSELGATCDETKNLFYEPNEKTRYRCLKAKIAIPFQLNGVTKKYIAELQIVHKNFEAVYDKTHVNIERVRIAYKQLENKEITKDQYTRFSRSELKECRRINDGVSKENKINNLLSENDYAYESYDNDTNEHSDNERLRVVQ